jgi:hypothetical protein
MVGQRGRHRLSMLLKVMSLAMRFVFLKFCWYWGYGQWQGFDMSIAVWHMGLSLGVAAERRAPSQPTSGRQVAVICAHGVGVGDRGHKSTHTR